MRHVLAPTGEEPGEAEWIIAAAGTVTNSVFAGKRLTHVAAKKAWTVPCSKALRGDVNRMGSPESCFHVEPPRFHGGKFAGKRGNRKT
jgi:hypothetical protein